MDDLLNFIREHKEELNLSDISRKSGYDPSYLKHVVAGRKRLTETATQRIKPVLDEMFKKYPIDTQGE